jgi:trans-2,3-dihydro-3-hydroxyanthranilate isomerase
MSEHDFMQVDAFTNQPLGGNPCAILFDTDGLDSATMLAVAKEMNLSETAFVRRSAQADFGVRYFTPAEEIPLAGHPTIATTFALVQRGQVALQAESTTITLELKAGVIEVEILRGADGGAAQIIMSQKKPEFLGVLDPAEVLPVFGLSGEDALPGVPVQIVSTGTPQLMVPVTGLDVLKRIQVDIPAYKRLRDQTGFFSPHVFCLQGVTEAGDTFARHFGVPPDTPEDPFTGSATGGMAAYLWHHGLIPQPTFTAEQGHWMGRPGTATVEVIGPPEDIETVKVGGSAVAVLEGVFTLP